MVLTLTEPNWDVTVANVPRIHDEDAKYRNFMRKIARIVMLCVRVRL